MTRQQRWAEAAFAAVRAAANADDGFRKKYATRCMKMPALLLRSGLVQSTAFILTRPSSEAATARFGDDLARALGEPGCESLGKLAAVARGAELERYLRLSRDAVEVASWFRRFAQSELGADEVSE